MSDKGFHFNHTRKTAVASLCLLAIVLLVMLDMLLPSNNRHESAIVSDNTSGWFESIPVDIFGDEKIAPGTEGEHDVSVKNTSNYEMKYELSVYTSEGYIPLEYRVKVKDEYVLGSEQEWLRVTALEGARRSQGSIPSGGKLDLTIEWRWPFESGGDELDTQIGASASQEKLYVTVFGLDRDVNSAPVVVKSDSVELIKPSLSAVAIFLVFLFLNGSSVNKWKNRVQRGSDKK